MTVTQSRCFRSSCLSLAAKISSSCALSSRKVGFICLPSCTGLRFLSISGPSSHQSSPVQSSPVYIVTDLFLIFLQRRPPPYGFHYCIMSFDITEIFELSGCCVFIIFSFFFPVSVDLVLCFLFCPQNLTYSSYPHF